MKESKEQMLQRVLSNLLSDLEQEADKLTACGSKQMQAEAEGMKYTIEKVKNVLRENYSND